MQNSASISPEFRETLVAFAERCAHETVPDGHRRGRKAARFAQKQIQRIHNTAIRASHINTSQFSLPQEFEWLLDNQYLLEREALDAALCLRRAGRLPASGSSLHILTLARKLCAQTNNLITTETISLFLQIVQKRYPLSERELSLFIPALKTALVASVAALCTDLDEIQAGLGKKSDSNPYAAELHVRRAREEGAVPPEALEKLADKAAPIHQKLNLLIGQAVTSLRFLSTADLTQLLQSVNMVEEILRRDPAGIYPVMDEASRYFYRSELSRLSKRHRLSEPACAAQVLKLAEGGKNEREKHVGYFLLTKPLGQKKSGLPGALYFTALALLTLALTVGFFFLTRRWWMSVILLIPFSDLSKNIVDFFQARLTRPRHIPRLELTEGLPDEGKTLCVISALLSDVSEGPHFAKLLEEYRFANRDAGEKLVFGLLADLPDSHAKSCVDDREVIESAQKAIHKLNVKYGGGFYFFLRDRQYNDADKVFMAWERKRGALLELMRALRGTPGHLRTLSGEPEVLKSVHYLITLDADTRLTAGSVREMVGAMLHPLNTPVVDAKRRVVTEGHALLQPRIAIDLFSAGQTMFSKIYAGHAGLDPYGGASSDLYQDLFSQGIFVGKGVFDVDAYLSCLDGRLPENRILSHDLLEGSYLRCGFLGDVELSDGFPARVVSFFDRLHRWTRGDWQLLPYLFPYVRTENGREKNPLSALSKWKIVDNLRRSLSPILLFTALLLSISGALPGLFASRVSSFLSIAGSVGLSSGISLPFLLLGGAALVVLASQLLLSAATLFAHGDYRARYHSTIISGLSAPFLQFSLQFLFLPYLVTVTLSAIISALWRSFISHRNLLEWVTSAQAESQTSGASTHLRRFYPALIWSAFCAVLSPLGWFFAIVWVTSPFVAHYVSRSQHEPPELASSDRALLLRQAALMWQYFEDFLTSTDHYLPPDNWQEQPAVGIAHRTSPTNIGLALLSTLSALDLKIITSEHALHLIDHVLSTVEALPKWNGHLYNWYNTLNCQPLKPRYISTVDSGNFAACLIALREGLLELSDAAAEDLAARADALSRAMEFAPLYDAHRRLFHIGYDMEKEELSDSFYDLLASEARCTSYLAIARGEVERRHWRRLGRALVSHDRYSGMASWTGTTFEYLMPHLLMPCYENSLLYESARFCVYCHRKRAAHAGIPWGISESCFFSFDNALNYQYKAHGVPRLAYKRGMGKELVISPYSTFLSLLISPFAAMKNLRALRRIGLEGHYGFFEAADYSPTRLVGDDKFEPIRCFMSHHLGMSILAIDNTLNQNVMQARFMRDVEMGAFAELLQEKVPIGAVKVRHFSRDIPEKPPRTALDGYRRQGEGYDETTPVCHILSNPSYTLLCTDAGYTASQGAELALTRFEPSSPGAPAGFIFFVCDGENCLGLTPKPFGQDKQTYSYEFDAGSAVWRMRTETLDASLSARIPDNEMAEWRSVTLENKTALPRKLTLACYFEPVLAGTRDFEAHPAFSKLFLETSIQGQTLMIRRRSRSGQGDAWMAFSCDHLSVRYDTSRAHVLGRGGLSAVKEAVRQRVEGNPVEASVNTEPIDAMGDSMDPALLSGPTEGAVLDPCVLAYIPLELPPRGSLSVCFSLSVAVESKDAQKAALRTLRLPENAARTGRLQSLSRVLGLSPVEVSGAFEILSALYFPRRSAPPERLRVNRLGQQDLWKFGISGDLPLLLAYCPDTTCTEQLNRLIRQHRLLSLSGIQSDLVVCLQEGGDYQRPVSHMIAGTLKALGAEHFLSRSGGVHIIDFSQCSEADQNLLYSCALWVMKQNKQSESASLPLPVLPEVEESPKEQKPFRLTLPQLPLPAQGSIPPYRYLADGSFQFDTTRSLPPLSWSHVCCNSGFGTLLTEMGAGYLWRFNARENKLTPWTNDPLAAEGGEQIVLRLSDQDISLFAASDGHPTTVTYGFGFARWEKIVSHLKVTTTAFVPTHRLARILLVDVETLDGSPPDTPFIAAHAANTGGTDDPGALSLHFHSRLLLSSNDDSARHILIEKTEGGVTARNAFNTSFQPQTYAMFSDGGLEDLRTGLAEFSCRIPLTQVGARRRCVLVNGCAANAPAMSLLRACADWTKAETFLLDTAKDWQEKVRPFKVETPDTNLNRYLNGWALYQVLASRLYGRTSLYQCGGAYGFRDQLQDVCALTLSSPELTRRQILRACARQFEEGDVQHWWHPSAYTPGHTDRGVRTTCSDDLLWLPYTVLEYLDHVDDDSLLTIKVPGLASSPLKPGEHDRYEAPARTMTRRTVFERCRMAIDLVLDRGVGAHDLLLMGGGDWNDGMNLVGAGGRGESVWLTWFASHVLTRFSALCARLGQEELAEKYRRASLSLSEAAGRAWDGQWYRRGYYDNGATLGSQSDEECQIDSIAQSFSTLSPQFTDHPMDQAFVEKSRQALMSAVDRLVFREHRLIALFTPAFAHTSQNPGYIKGYVAGVRENGGQYTHAAVWLAMGLLRAGRADEGYELLNMLLPATHNLIIYRSDPHVLAADVYSNPLHVGRGGWSHYTGAASWYYRVAIEGLLGLYRKGEGWAAKPQLPGHWDGFSVDGVRFSRETETASSEEREPTSSIRLS